jgi:23S rRNA (uracil1939-C5)-methyltransferase
MKRHAPGTTRVRAVVRELANGGDGVAIVEVKGERRAVFVRGAAVGDELDLSVDLGTRPARGRILSIEKAGPGRIVPVCPHASSCGGCAWMHLSPSGQEEAHRQLVRATLPDAWGRIPLVFHPPLESLGYRTRARLAARASGGRAVVGLREAGTHDAVEVDRCVVLHPELDLARLAVGPLLEGARGRGEAQLALGALGRPVLELTWEGRLDPKTFARLESGVKSRAWAGARVFEGETRKPSVVGDPTPWTVGADGEPLRLAPGGFAQASEKANVALGGRLLGLVAGVLGDSLGAVVELFAGAGNFTVLLARHAARVVAVEASGPACEAARQNLGARGLTAKVVEALAEEHPLRKATDLVVLDPPRTGARLVAERLALARPRVIAYVSCDLPTLARDLEPLEAAFEPVAIEAFAMFPYTPHLETLAVLARRRRAS